MIPTLDLWGVRIACSAFARHSSTASLLRTDSANFSTSGENAQDNDLIVIRDAGAAARLDAPFERMWDAAEPMIEFYPAILALEPTAMTTLRRDPEINRVPCWAAPA
jgi:hypothetical protein